ncbi:MAG: DNA recombination protein RmuC [Phycisphaerales bacterium]|nr:MAG: DNA recombination protein RmuC [Phycisphaerales bacterium]
MDALSAVLLVLVVVLGSLVAWLAIGRGRLARAAASGEARAEASEAQLAARLAAQEQAAVARDAALRESYEQRLRDLRDELAGARSARDASAERVTELSTKLAGARQQLASLEEMRQELARNEEKLRQTFENLANRTLGSASETLLNQAKAYFAERAKDSAQEDTARAERLAQLVAPIRETLHKTQDRLVQLDERIEQAGASSQSLRDETARLTRALSRPEIRGQYGEIQLRRVAELAGMTSYCDFDEQTSTRDSEGQLLRPDMLVRLPNERVIAVDAKTNTYAYIEAVNAQTDEERELHLSRFARHVSEQAKKLSDKKYWSAYEGSPEFVVMFVPGDHFIDAALQRQPELIDVAAQHNVILASPSTLIGLLRAVAVGWREHKLADEAKELFQLGKELHDRASVAFDHAARLGDSIRQAVERYNKFVGSIDRRMMPTLRKFEEAGAKSAKSLAEPKPVDQTPALLEAAGEHAAGD